MATVQNMEAKAAMAERMGIEMWIVLDRNNNQIIEMPADAARKLNADRYIVQGTYTVFKNIYAVK